MTRNRHPKSRPSDPAGRPDDGVDDDRQAGHEEVAPRRPLAIALRWLRRLALAALALGLAGVVGIWLVLRHYEQDLPSTAELKHYHPPQVTRVVARDDSLLAELFVQRRTVVSIAQIPKVMRVAVLAAEDADFYQHEGLDYLGMLRALVVNLRSASARQGGSTITQQVVKNVILTPERTFERKAREVLLARRIEQELSKDEILELYLNHIYFGHGRYGIEEASRYYFGKGVGEVSLAEAALLAGLPKAPSLYSPRVDFERAQRRRDTVLEQIALKGFADPRRVEKAKQEPIVLAPAVESLPELAPEVVSEVRRTLRDIVGPGAIRGGYTVTTSIDPGLQAAARKAVRNNLDDYAKRHGLLAPLDEKRNRGLSPFQGTPRAKGHHIYHAVVSGADDAAGVLQIRVGTVEGIVPLRHAGRYNPKGLPPSRFAAKGTILRVSPVLERAVGPDGVPREYRLELGPQSALVAVDVASREIRALVGSYEAVRGGLDRASFALRQPGSSFKPFVYSYGIHTRRLTAATALGPPPSDPASGAGEGPTKPPLRVRQAVAQSVNEAAVWALRDVGAEGVVRWAQAMGITTRLGPTDSLALGAYEVRPRELAAAYATFAAGGTYDVPVLITKVVGPDGNEVDLGTATPRRRVMEEAEAYLVTSLLTSVVQAGTARRARSLPFPVAGKTGTTNDSKDAWFAGYSPEMVCVVWTGYDDAVSLGKREVGATAALPAFIELMKAAHHHRKVAPFKRPAGIVDVAIDPLSGLLAYEEQEDALTELFLAGTEPVEVAEPPDAGADGGGGSMDAGPAEDLLDGGGGASPADDGGHDPIDEDQPVAQNNDEPPAPHTSATASTAAPRPSARPETTTPPPPPTGAPPPF
jgi:penicillin-binding protein 1A